MTIHRSFATLVLTSLLAGCSDDATSPTDSGAGDSSAADTTADTEIDSGTPDTSAVDSSSDTGSPVDTGTTPDGGDSGTGCPAPSARPIVDVTADITTETTWGCDKIYKLSAVTYVNDGVTLHILPGAVIQGDGKGALVVARGAKLDAVGTAKEPIVFTSAKPGGSRVPGDWGGVALLGGAKLNGTKAEESLEGLSTSEPRAKFGGTDDTWDCGKVQYVRIEFAGYKVAVDKELNGLTLAGCGSKTTVDYVQVHRGSDDGIEMFGGTTDLKHIVITGAQDDGFDWDFGYRGRVQYLIIQQHKDAADRGFEGDHRKGEEAATVTTPVSSPTMYNITMIGNKVAGSDVDDNSRQGMKLRRGTGGVFKNILMMGFGFEAIDVTDKATADGARLTVPRLTVENSVFFDIGTTGTFYFDPAEGNDDDWFDENAFFTAATRNNRFGTDPKLVGAYNLKSPGFVPAADSICGSGAATPPSDSFFDIKATWVGAIKPGGADWTQGWTSYPEN